MCHSRPLFRYFRLLNTVVGKQMFKINFCRPLVSEATTLPTEPQPLPEPKCFNVHVEIGLTSPL